METPERVAPPAGASASGKKEGLDEEILCPTSSASFDAGGVGQSVSSPRLLRKEDMGGLAPCVAAADGRGRDLRGGPAVQDQKQDERKAVLLSEVQVLCQKFKNDGPRDAIQRLISALNALKDLENWDSDFQTSCKQKFTSMQVGIMEMEKGICNCDKDKGDDSIIEQSIVAEQEKLNLAKRELGAKLRAILSLKREIDGRPTPTELIQYEHRFSELNVQIQERLQQTRKHYDTYNVLLEIKELMLKEISLLNSISSQFQEAIVDIAARSKFMDSLEAILKGTQQKLKKVEDGLHSEQKIRDSLKETYSTAVAELRHFSSLLKAFQEECTKIERFQSLTSA